MPTHICVTCGTQFPPAGRPPEQCAICQDERQYIGLKGQQWITLEDLRTTHRNAIYEESPGIWGIAMGPKFAIGQRGLLIQNPAGNILWDCVSLIDSDTVDRIQALGRISAIAISHPHYYSSMIEWSEAFGGAPIYLHEDDRQWVQRHGPCIRFWQGETHALAHGFTLVRLGGHFAGYQVLHSSESVDGLGTLFSGDLPQVCMDRRWVSFMYSYPNYLPLSVASVDRIVAALEPFEFGKLFGAWPGFVIRADAKSTVRRSAERYLRALTIDR
ncbi:MAG: MBL fold metallo-hydrolase [Acidobacteriota bacterium]